MLSDILNLVQKSILKRWLMSGHNKWSTIKHKKAKTDAAKGKAFTKSAMEIMAAVRGGGDTNPDNNAQLRMAIINAKAANMPNDNIKRAIEKAAGAGDGVIIEEIVYEGYAPGGVALIIEVMTDNRNRAAAHVRSTLDKNGGNLGAAGSVAWIFEKQGHIVFEPGKTTEEQIMDIAIDAGAEDIKTHEDGSIEVFTPIDAYMAVRDAVEKAGIEMALAKLEQIPKNLTEITDADQARKIMSLLEKIEDIDDVQAVYANYDISDEIMSSLDN
jgi:YebC/PmpR family DNA-binding regulatory protein